MNIDIKTVVIVLVVLFVLYNVCRRDEKFDPTFDPNNNGYYVTKCVSPGSCGRKLSEPKFGPKQFAYLKKPYKLNKQQRDEMERKRLKDSPYEWQLSAHTHRGEHTCRNEGLNPSYHDVQKVQYIPGWPNVTDDWENIEVMLRESIANEDDYPVIVKSNKMNVDEMVY